LVDIIILSYVKNVYVIISLFYIERVMLRVLKGIPEFMGWMWISSNILSGSYF